VERLPEKLTGTWDGSPKKQTLGCAAQFNKQDSEEWFAKENHENFTEENREKPDKGTEGARAGGKGRGVV
jgi:hypothetical protein